MSLLQNTDWAGVNAAQRVLAKAILRCQIGDIREEGPVDSRPPKPADGEQPQPALTTEETVIVPMTTLQEASTTDKDKVAAGFPLTARLRILTMKNGEPLPENLATANRINQEAIKRLMLAGLGLKRTDKSDVQKMLIERGGWSALTGKQIMVDVAVRTNNGSDFQDFKGFSMVPEGQAAAPANPY